MASPRLSRLVLRIRETLWSPAACSIREIQEALAEKNRPGFTTVQTMVCRLNAQKALRRTKRIGKANIFEAVVSREAAERKLIGELLSLFGTKPVMAHMVKSGRLTLEDVKEAEEELRRLAQRERLTAKPAVRETDYPR